MKKSNIIIGGIALAVLGVVIVCLAAFRVKPEWKAEREEQRNPATEQKAIAGMMDFATKCKDVEELVIQSSKNIKGETFVFDSTQFSRQSMGEVNIDTVFSNGGKKLSFTIEPQKDAQVVYYYLQLALPSVKSISTNNINLGINGTSFSTLKLQLQGESGCDLKAKKGIGNLQVVLGGLSAFYYKPSNVSDSISIKASGNAIVQMPEAIAKQLQQQGKLILQENAIVQ
jgi:hypothetical protein